MRVFKYKLQRATKQSISFPVSARILDAQLRDGDIHVWATVDESKPSAPRTFEVIGSGEQFADDPERQYIATVQGNGGGVWHVFVYPEA